MFPHIQIGAETTVKQKHFCNCERWFNCGSEHMLNGHKLTYNTCTKVSALFLAGPFMLTLRPSSPPWPPATPMARRPTPSYTPQWEMPYWGLWSAGLIERPWPFYKTGSARPLLSSNRMWVENPLMKVKHTIEPVNMKKIDTGKLI